MSVWFAIPSKRTEGESQLRFWRAMGYNLALWRDPGDPPLACTLLMQGPYPGYAKAVNALCKAILEKDPEAEWIVTGGDDVQPDMNHPPGLIAAQCTEHFGGTFGVMQPTGDRWGEGHPPDGSPYIERVCGSPWFGRGYCRLMYGGQGPLWPGWSHMFEDEEAQEVARMYGVLWQRRDLIHLHKHWGREPVGYGKLSNMPDFLKDANARFRQDEALFKLRKKQGFPGHQPTGHAVQTVDVTQHNNPQDAVRWTFT